MQSMRQLLVRAGVLVPVLLLTMVTPALGWSDYEGSNQPTVLTEPVNEAFEDELCGVSVNVVRDGTVHTRYTFNRGLGIQFDTHTWNVRTTITNPATGRSLTIMQSGGDRLAFEVLENGDYTGTVTLYISSQTKATVPGAGLVLRNGGREVVLEVSRVIDQESFDWEFISREILFDSNELFGDLDALCNWIG